MGFCCSTAVQENVDPGITIGKSPRVELYKEIVFPEEPALDFWTKQDWEQFLEIQTEAIGHFEAMPDEVKKNG